MSYSSDTTTRTLELLHDIVGRFENVITFQRTAETSEQSLRIVEGIARSVGLLEGLPGDMTTVTRSIGTGGRDYSTISSWESDLDNVGIYSSGDDAVGEMYNDSAFDENVVINGGTTVGLNSTTLTVASGERHDGTAGTGARLAVTANNRRIETVSGGIARTVEWLEYDGNGNDPGDPALELAGSPACARNVIAHQITSSSGAHDATFVTRSGQLKVLNSIFYDALETATGTAVNAGFEVVGTSAIEAKNVTIHDIRNEGGSGTVYGIQFTDSVNADLRNCLVTDVTGTTSGSISCFNITSPSSATVDYCASSDTSASGANSLTSIASADQYVSTVKGSEDLHLKTGADAIGEGVDLGTTDGVNIDIDGRDRDAEGDTWDIGADQFVSAGGTSSATSAVASAGATISINVSFGVQDSTASASVSSSGAEVMASASNTPPSFTATSAVNSGPASMDADATFSVDTFTATSSLIAAPSDFGATASTGKPVYTGSASLLASASQLTAVGSFQTPLYDASAAVTAAPSEFAASAVSGDAFIGDAALTASGSTLAATATFTASAIVPAGFIFISDASISVSSASASIAVAKATATIQA